MNTNRGLVVAGCIVALVVARSVLPDGIVLLLVFSILLGTAIYNGYLLYQDQQQSLLISKNIKMNYTDPNRPTFMPVNPVKKHGSTRILLIGLVVGLLVLFRITAPVAFYFFTVGDNLNLTYSGSPYLIWAIYGAFAGAVFGGFIACKKFRLRYIYVLYPVLALLLLLIILVVYNASFKSHNFATI